MFGDKSTQDISTKVPWFWRGFFPQSQIINQSLLSIIEDDKQCRYWGIQRNSIRVFNNWTIHDIVHPIPKFGPIRKIGVGEIMSLWIAQMLQFCMIFFLWILIKLTLHKVVLLIYRDTFQSLSYTIPASTTVSIGQKRSNQHHSQLVHVTSTSSKRIVLSDDRLSWPALLRADNKELGRMVAGLNNTVKALNDYLMELLQERDVLHSQQDEMLEHISELTDSLL